ncbi:MAG: DUF4105 domain-containing protein [Gemmatimonadota bacterium]
MLRWIRAAAGSCALACAAAAGGPLQAQVPAAVPAQHPGTALTIYLATFGPGDRVWEKFGHNAIWIHDAGTGSTTSYNYGMFDFAQPGFVPRLIRGSMLYRMDVRSADEELAAYRHYNRQVTAQRLSLSDEQKHQLREFLEWNWLPDNREYLYDYFRDNCSTRVRDALDRVLNGALQQQLASIATAQTWRSHSLRLTAGSIPTYTGLLLGLGMPSDRPLSAWEEGFIPMNLMDRIRAIEVPDGRGGTMPLVADEQVLFEADREPLSDQAPARTPAYLLAGLLTAAGLLALARNAGTSVTAADRHRTTAFALAAALSCWGVVTGFFGSLLAGLWLFTDHTAAYPNLNLLQVNPLGFVLAVAGPLAVAGAAALPYGGVSAALRVARVVAWSIALLAVGGLLLRLLPGLHQASGPIIAFAVPVHLSAVASLYLILRGRRESVAPTLP